MDFLFELPDGVFTWVDYIVVWTGYSVIIGYLASMIVMRGKWMIPTVGTVAVGYVGTVVGWSMAALYIGAADRIEGGWKEKLFAPATILIALAGAAGLLFLFKTIRNSGRETDAK